MADNITLPGTAAVVASDDIGGVQHQYVKVEYGAADSATPVSLTNPLPTFGPDVSTSGAIAANAQAVTLAINGESTFGILVTGTWTGTLSIERSIDGTSYKPINAAVVGVGSLSQTISDTGTGTPVHLTGYAGSSAGMRVIATAWTSGTATVYIRCGSGVGAVFQVASIPAGDNVVGRYKLTDGTSVAAVKAASTAAVAADPSAVVAFSPNSPVPLPTITKATQGATGVTTQDLKDAGRNPVTYYMLIPVLTSATDTLQSLTGTKSGATVTATTTPAVVTTGKTFRVSRFACAYIATATAGYGIVRLRFNTAGVVAITSPIALTLAVGAGTPATAGSANTEDAAIPDGIEFAAGTGVGISAQGFAAATATAVGYVFASITGYEY